MSTSEDANEGLEVSHTCTPRENFARSLPCPVRFCCAVCLVCLVSVCLVCPYLSVSVCVLCVSLLLFPVCSRFGSVSVSSPVFLAQRGPNQYGQEQRGREQTPLFRG